MKITSFWHGGTLPNIVLLSLATWQDHGHEVDLYHLEPILNCPDGVNLRNAEEVLPGALIDRLVLKIKPEKNPAQGIVSYSDIFRMRQMQLGLGAWFDLDVVLFKPFDPDPNRAFFARDGKDTIGVSALYFPPDDPLVAEYLKVLDKPDLMPDWLGFKRGVLRKGYFKLIGQEIAPPDLGKTVFGNDAALRLLKKHGRLHEAAPANSFYKYSGKGTLNFYDPKMTSEFLDDPSLIGFHVHRKILANKLPDPESCYGRLLARHAARLPELAWED